jgi:hypothetical protein
MQRVFGLEPYRARNNKLVTPTPTCRKKMTRSENPIGARRFVYIRCFAHDFPERGPSLFDPAQIARSQS